jgi:hypothetical protein
MRAFKVPWDEWVGDYAKVTLNVKRTWLRAIPKRESCILGKIFIEDIDGDGTLTANWCFGLGEIRLVASEGCATKTGDF